MSKVLLISDNQSFALDLSDQIQLYAPEFEVVINCEDSEEFDIYILDNKPLLIQELKEKHIKKPIILLKPNGEYEDSVNEPELTIIKPFYLNDFLNKLKSCINVFENSCVAYLRFNQYELHPSTKEILNLRNQEVVKLTEKEIAIIKYLYKAKDHIVTKNDLLRDVWDYNAEVTTHTIETHIYRLRQKVEQDNPDAQLILTEDGGYRLKF